MIKVVQCGLNENIPEKYREIVNLAREDDEIYCFYGNGITFLADKDSDPNLAEKYLDFCYKYNLKCCGPYAPLMSVPTEEELTKPKQIFLEYGNQNNNNKLIGKTIKDISYDRDTREEESWIIVIFTDGTYIHIGVDEDYISSDNDDMMHQLSNCRAKPLNCYSIVPGFVDEEKNKVVYCNMIKEQLRMGLINDDEEYAMKSIQDYEKRRDEREYKQYLRLKEKFENN